MRKFCACGAFVLWFPIVSKGQPITIMPVGDSITVGMTDNPTWSVPYEDGFRGDLYKELVSAGYSFNYVGNSPQPWDGDSGTPTNTPAFDLRSINQDNFEAFSGFYPALLAPLMPGWMQTYHPDIVLLDIGINGIAEGPSGTASFNEPGLLQIVQDFVQYDPGGHLIVSQVTPFAEYTQGVVDENNWIANTLVPEYAAYGVTTVDQYTPMLVDGQPSASMYANGINHPNAAGYQGMANVYLAGIEAILSPANASSPRVITAAVPGVLDLQKSGAIVQDVDLGTITSEIAAGYAGGAWNGSGITSTAAMFDSSHLTALGVMSNSGPSGQAIYATFEGTAVTADDVLIKYTYYGDCNLDGKVDGSDYSLLDYAYAFNVDPANASDPLTGWSNGDFNYDGVIDGSDYTLIDNAFNNQGVPFADAISTALIAPQPVPEPGCVGLPAVGLMLARRRRSLADLR